MVGLCPRFGRGIRDSVHNGKRRQRVRRNADLWEGALGKDTGKLNISTLSEQRGISARVWGFGGCLHQQTGFSAGTVTNDDEFAANLSHDMTSEGKGQQASVIDLRKKL